MKKLFTVLIAFTLIFAACDDGSGNRDNSDVIGIWTANYGTGNTGEIKLDIAKSTWALLFTNPDKTMLSYNGTWDRNGNTLTLYRSYYSNATASLSGDKLILNQNWTTRLSTCELTKKVETPPAPPLTGTTLKINNLSDYPLVSVEYSSVDFGIIRSGKDVTKNVNAGTKYIYFVLQTSTDNMVRCRTAPVTCEDNKKNETIIVNNTIITITTTEESDTLRNICEKHGVKGMLYDIGNTGPGGGIIFFAEGGQYKECSGELGSYSWSDAVSTAKNHRGGGFTNWSLPDRGELSLIYQNLHSKGLGGFSGDAYWSSTEYDYSDAYVMNFSTGSQTRNFKSGSYRVRAVRSFSL